MAKKKARTATVKERSAKQRLFEEAYVEGWEMATELSTWAFFEEIDSLQHATTAWEIYRDSGPKPKMSAAARAWQKAAFPDDGILVDGVQYRVETMTVSGKKLITPTMQLWKPIEE